MLLTVPPHSSWFKNGTLLLVIVNAAFLTLERPSLKPSDPESQVLRVVDIVFSILWTLEAGLRISAYGFLQPKRAYLRSGWNRVDAVILLASWTSVVLSSTGSDSITALVLGKITRIIVTMKPLRIVQRISSVKQTMQTL